MNSDEKDEWLKAIDEELKSLLNHDTWELLDATGNEKVLGNMWIFTRKYDSQGRLLRYKARLVVLGNQQQYNVDFTETFSPTLRFTSLRLLIMVATHYDWTMFQLDVKTAFLYGDLEEDIFMKLPDGYLDQTNRRGKICKLKKSLYGLKQSPRQWKKNLDTTMRKLGFLVCSVELGIYKLVAGDLICYCGFYVDDGLFISNDDVFAQECIRKIGAIYEVTIKGELKDVLGLEVIRDRKNKVTYLSQTHYLINVLKNFQMEYCKSQPTPMTTGVYNLLESDSVTLNEDMKRKYQKMVGSLIWLSVTTRCDIAYAVGIVSRFMSCPTETHLQLVKRIFRYLNGTRNFVLKLSGGLNMTLSTDADWAGDPKTRRSVSGFILQLGNSTVSWGSKQQRSVSLSSTESEFIAASMGLTELIWMESLMKQLDLNVKKPIKMMMDNQGALVIAKNAVQHHRTKHIDTRYHFIREKVEEGFVQLKYCATSEMLADGLTKPLGRFAFETFRNKIGIMDLVFRRGVGTTTNGNGKSH